MSTYLIEHRSTHRGQVARGTTYLRALLTPRDGAAAIEIYDRSVDGVYLAREGSEDFLEILAQEEVEWATPARGEGSIPLGSSTPNIQRVGRVWLTAANETALEALALRWQQVLADSTRYGADLTYTSRTGAVRTIEVLRASAQRQSSDEPAGSTVCMLPLTSVMNTTARGVVEVSTRIFIGARGERRR